MNKLCYSTRHFHGLWRTDSSSRSNNIFAAACSMTIMLCMECQLAHNDSIVLGADYTLPQSLQYVFNTSTMSGDRLCLEFGILDDDNFEGDHSFVVSVSPPTSPPGITIGTDSVEVTIEDDDG